MRNVRKKTRAYYLNIVSCRSIIYTGGCFLCDYIPVNNNNFENTSYNNMLYNNNIKNSRVVSLLHTL